MMTPNFAKSRAELPWLPYPESDRVIINAHNFNPPPPTSVGFGDELLILRGPTGVTDQSGNGNNGAYNGGMGTVSDTGSGGSVAFLFDGTDDFINLPVPVVSAMPLTLAAWVKLTATSGIGSIVCISTSAGTNHYWLMRHNSANLEARSRAGGTGSSGSVSGLTTGWHLCIGEFLSSTSRTARRDTTSGTTATANRNPTGMDVLTVGFGYGADNGYLNGRVDDIRVFDRVLTPTEISDWVTAGRGYDA